MRRLASVVLAVVLAGCGRDGDGGGGGGGGAATGGGGGGGGGGAASGPARVVPGATPVVLLTWHVGVNDNVSQAQLDALYAALVAFNDTLWNVTEGQVRIDRLVIRDAVAPGVPATSLASINTSDVDLIVFTLATWDANVDGFVNLSMGRTGRIIAVPLSPATELMIHEAGHFLWTLQWDVSGFWGEALPILIDEYADDIAGPDDDACIMEDTYWPLRWCSAANHAAQPSQPTSCWQQILVDYPAFSYAGTDVAATAAPAPVVEFTNVP